MSAFSMATGFSTDAPGKLDSSIKLCDIGANLCDEMYFGIYNEKKRHPIDLLGVLQRSKTLNVHKIICTAGSEDDCRKTLKILSTPTAASESLEDTLPPTDATEGAEREPCLAESFGLYMTVGVHPTRCDAFAADDAAPSPVEGRTAAEEEGALEVPGTGTGSRVLDSLLSLIHFANLDERRGEGAGAGAADAGAGAPELRMGRGRRTVVAVGECGLDYARLHFCTREQQLQGFLKQLRLAAHPLVDLPLFLHSRDTDGEFLRIMQENQHLYAKRGGVVHSFDGDMGEMQALCQLGLHIGLNGCSLRTEKGLEVAKAIPADRLLLETDAPWCSIKKTHPSHAYVQTQFATVKKEKWAGGSLVKDRNEPCATMQVAEVVAAVRGVSLEQLAEQCWENSERLFFFQR